MLPRVGPFSTMKLSRPVRMVETDHAGFQVSGWKSVMDKHNLGEQRGGGKRKSSRLKAVQKKQTKTKHYKKYTINQSRHESPILPCIALKSPIWCYHVDTWGFKRKFSGKYKLSMVISAWKETIQKQRNCRLCCITKKNMIKDFIRYLISWWCRGKQKLEDGSHLHREFSQALWRHSAWRGGGRKVFTISPEDSSWTKSHRCGLMLHVGGVGVHREIKVKMKA